MGHTEIQLSDSRSANREQVEEREAQFWDRSAENFSDEDLVAYDISNYADPVLRLDLLTPLKDKRVLDVGCGVGLWASRLAMQGALVTAVDISPMSCAAARRAAEINGVANRVDVHVASAYDLPFPDKTFDAVHGENIIHHLDPEEFGVETARVLKTGGIAVFSENSSRNKLLMLARDHLCGRFGIPKWSTDDEYPLSPDECRKFAEPFSRLDLYYPEFLFAGLLNAKVFKYQNRHANAILGGLDRFVSRHLKCAHHYSYRQLIVCTR